MKRLNAWLGTLLLSLGISTGFAALAVPPINGLLPDHLEYHRNWLCSKAALKMGLLGADEFAKNGGALEGGHVNLGAWYGFQEILFRRQLIPGQIAFRFRLGHGASVTVVFNKDADGFEGIRLSADPGYPSACLRGLDTGEFAEKDPLALSPPLITEGVWHQARLTFSGDRVTLGLDDQTISVHGAPAGRPGWVGFRGGYGDTFVDDVSIMEAGNPRPYAEDFETHAASGILVRLILLCAAYLFLPVLFTVALLGKDWRGNSRRFRIAYGTLMAGIMALFAAILLVPSEPPSMEELRGYVRGFYPEQLCEQLDALRLREQEFTSEYLHSPLESEERVLFLGTSQTFGIGARNGSESFVAQLQAMFDARTNGQRCVECFNGGIPGSVARHLLQAYAETYIKVRPTLTVVNLSCNDHYIETPDFAAALRGIVQLDKNMGIKTLFVLEAASPDVFPDGFPTYRVVREVAAENCVPVFNPQDCMKAHRDDGFLFWDMVHPTSYGYRRLAECLFPPIAAQLGPDAAP